jgi:hypothetical protein
MPELNIMVYCGICFHTEGRLYHEHPDDGRGLVFECENCKNTISRLRDKVKDYEKEKIHTVSLGEKPVGKLKVWNSSPYQYSPVWHWEINVGGIKIGNPDKSVAKEDTARRAGEGWAKLLNITLEKQEG